MQVITKLATSILCAFRVGWTFVGNGKSFRFGLISMNIMCRSPSYMKSGVAYPPRSSPHRILSLNPSPEAKGEVTVSRGHPILQHRTSSPLRVWLWISFIGDLTHGKLSVSRLGVWGGDRGIWLGLGVLGGLGVLTDGKSLVIRLEVETWDPRGVLQQGVVGADLEDVLGAFPLGVLGVLEEVLVAWPLGSVGS